MTNANTVLTDNDFDAYLPSRATSNAFVRARIPVKDKLLDLGRDLASRAAERGLTLEVVASDERPTIFNKKSVTEQWVFLWRDRDAREQLEKVSEQPAGMSALLTDSTPYLKHAFLGLRLDASRFEVCWRLHRDAWADVKNARRRLETDEGRASLSTALAGLTEGFLVGVAGGETAPAQSCEVARVGEFLETAVRDGSWLVVARTFSRAEAIGAGEGLDERVRELFEALLPLHRTLAWFANDDVAAVSDDLARKMAEHNAMVAQVTAREAEWQAEHQAEIERRRTEATAETRERVAAFSRPSTGRHARPVTGKHFVAEPVTGRHRNTVAEEPITKKTPIMTPPTAMARPTPVRPVAAPPRDGENASNDPQRAAPKHFPLLSEVHGGRDFRERGPVPRVARREAPDGDLVESTHPPGVGARVRIRQGAFAGKIGTVIELDARGAARVTVGGLTARVESGDLVTLVEKA
jgi:hypothetical protein